MESLRAAYVDEDDNNDNNHTESPMATEAAPSPLRRNPQEIPNLSNTNNNDDETESSNDENNNNNDNGNEASDNNNNGEPELEDPRQPPTTTSSSEEDASAIRPRKKQKPLSSFAPASPPPAPTSATTPAPTTTTTTQTTTTKKPKKKSNNVWTKSTSRKSKKKSKPAAATSAAQQSAVLITPVPRFPDKSDDSPDASICLSKIYKAEKVELSDDRLSAGSTKGYRMVRATRGVVEGAWYFEIKVVHLGETGHTRLGWTTEKGDLQAPVGYDGNSFGYRDVDGSKVHGAVREKYGDQGYGEGDVVGCYISLPDGESYAPKPPQLVWYKGQRYAYAADGKDDPPKVVPESEISFFKNGLCQGVAFTNLFGGQYYPAASMFTRPNQLNCVVKFNFGPDFDFFPEDFGDRPQPRPMIEVPYHGYDGRVEDPPQNGLSAEKKN